MKFLVVVLLLAALTNAAERRKEESRNKQKTEETPTKTEKRELTQGNAGVGKRLAVLPTETPGIVYADTKDALAEKSPIQQIYATPVPQIPKISDVLTGQGPAFPAAITSHLYSPISIYQPKLATPTTFQVSAPVPSQLAYAEKISYQNPVQFTTQVLYNQQQPQFANQINFPRYNAVQVQQAFHQQLQQQNPRLFTHPQTFETPQEPQVVANQPPQYQNPQNLQNTQSIYSQIQQRFAQLAQAVQPQPGIVYARQENVKETQRPIQRELKNKDEQQPAVQEKLQTQNHNTQPQAAVSFASFSQAPIPYNQQQQQQQIHIQNQNQAQTQYQTQVQPQFLIQVPQYPQAQPIQPQQQQQEIRQYKLQEQPQQQIQYQPQAQSNFQIQIPQYQQQIQYRQPQFISKLEAPVANSIATPVKQPVRQVVYLRPAPQVYQVQPQYQGHPQPGLGFPAVQYFGKFAQEIFGGYQHNQ